MAVNRIKFTISATLPSPVDTPYEKTAYAYTATFTSPELEEPMMLTVPVGQEAGYLPIYYSTSLLKGDIFPIDCINPIFIDGEYYVPDKIAGMVTARLYSAWLDYQAIKEFIGEIEIPITVYPNATFSIDLRELVIPKLILAGTITRKELEYDQTRGTIPVS